MAILSRFTGWVEAQYPFRVPVWSLDEGEIGAAFKDLLGRLERAYGVTPEQIIKAGERLGLNIKAGERIGLTIKADKKLGLNKRTPATPSTRKRSDPCESIEPSVEPGEAYAACIEYYSSDGFPNSGRGLLD